MAGTSTRSQRQRQHYSYRQQYTTTKTEQTIKVLNSTTIYILQQSANPNVHRALGNLYNGNENEWPMANDQSTKPNRQKRKDVRKPERASSSCQNTCDCYYLATQAQMTDKKNFYKWSHYAKFNFVYLCFYHSV